MCFLLLQARCYICYTHTNTQAALVAYFMRSPMAHVAILFLVFPLAPRVCVSEGTFLRFSPYKLCACTLYKMQNNMICSYFHSHYFPVRWGHPFECTQGNDVESKSNCAKINGARRLFKLKFNRNARSHGFIHFNFSHFFYHFFQFHLLCLNCLVQNR